MKTRIIISFLLISLLLSCSSNNDSNDDDNGGNGGGGLVASATYEITFTANFTSETHPDDYPDNAIFTNFFLVAHNETKNVFKKNTIASDALKTYIEMGENDGLINEFSSDDTNISIVKTGGQTQPTGQSVTTITINERTLFLSFISGISPSPDWFVGVDSFNFANSDNTLVESAEIELFAYDAGINGGTTYTSDPVEESQFVKEISTSPFAFESGGVIFRPALGTLKITRVN